MEVRGHQTFDLLYNLAPGKLGEEHMALHFQATDEGAVSKGG